MSAVIDTSSVTLNDVIASFDLLQLPDVALELVLQQLDLRSCASTAVSCSKLSHVVPATISTVEVRCCSPETLGSLCLWFAQHSSSLAKLTECSLAYDVCDPPDPSGACLIHTAPLWRLPCPQLRQLRLTDFEPQLEPTATGPGVLHDCTGLTALELQSCDVQDSRTAFAAIAALPQLQSLKMTSVYDEDDIFLFHEAQRPLQLTHLTIDYGGCYGDDNIGVDELSHLSALVRLEELCLCAVIPGSLSNSLPSQLQKLTRLAVSYADRCDASTHFQHLSSLTALQHVSLRCRCRHEAGYVHGIANQLQHLSHLTELVLSHFHLQPTRSTHTWAHFTALESVTLSDCVVQPQTLAALTTLRSLTLGAVTPVEGASLGQLLLAAAKLSLLTGLDWSFQGDGADLLVGSPPAAAFTAVTASTHLCSLKLQEWKTVSPEGRVLFKAGPVYPHLTHVTLADALCTDVTAVNEQQLQQLCSCCPAVKSLAFELWTAATPAACLPLIQLSALTELVMRSAADNSPTAVDTAAQLTGLKCLQLYGMHQLLDPALLQLTALSSLEQLAVSPHASRKCFSGVLWLRNKVRQTGHCVWTGTPCQRLPLRYACALGCTATCHVICTHCCAHAFV
jgi:hypothetical protein